MFRAVSDHSYQQVLMTKTDPAEVVCYIIDFFSALEMCLHGHK